MKIGLLSDTHGTVDKAIYEHFADVDEIWHAGDAGNIDVITELETFKPLKAVWGNCDDFRVRGATSEHLFFTSGGMKILMIHIGGYPGRYDRRAFGLIKELKPDLFVCGHSHILKIIFDKTNNLLCVNPGSAGKSGIHKVMTLLRFCIEDGKISNMEVIEFGRRGNKSAY